MTSAIDNLLKGAAGQAVQNANLMLRLDESAGLPRDVTMRVIKVGGRPQGDPALAGGARRGAARGARLARASCTAAATR